MEIAENYEKKMYDEAPDIDFGDGSNFFDELMAATPTQKRSLFYKYIDDRFALDRFDKAETARFDTQKQLALGDYKDFFKDEFTPIDDSEESHAAKAEVERFGQKAFDAIFYPREVEDTTEIEKIMVAYDQLHPAAKPRRVEYELVKLGV